MRVALLQKWEPGMDCRRAIRDFVLYVDELSSIVIEVPAAASRELRGAARVRYRHGERM